MHQGRNGRVAVVNGKIYVIGGFLSLSPPMFIPEFASVGTNEEYDPGTNNWTAKKSMPTPREGFGIAAYNNKIYCIGGVSGVNEVYDPATDTWETKKPMPTARSNLQANVVNGKIYLIGGYNTTINEVYDPATDSWATKTKLPIGVGDYASAVVDNKIFVIGGVSISGNSRYSSNITQIYNPETDSWSSGAPLPINMSYGSAGVTTGNFAPKRIYAFGIPTSETLFNSETKPCTTLIYNPGTDSWTVGKTILTNRVNVGVAVIKDVLFVIGGHVHGPFGYDTATAVNEQYMPSGYQVIRPSVSIVSPENTTYTKSNVSLALIADVPLLSYSIDGKRFVDIDGSLTLTELHDGFHCITVCATDALTGSNRVSETVYFTVDKTPLSISVLSPERNKSYNTTDLHLNFTVSEAVMWMSCSLDAQENVTLTGNTTITSLSYGSHNVTVYGQDILGKVVASETRVFNIAEEPAKETATESSQIVLIAVVAAPVAIVGAGLLYYLLRSKRQTGKQK